MNRPYNYESVPKPTYKGGLGSVGDYVPYGPTDAQLGIDPSVGLPVRTIADLANIYGGLQNLYPLISSSKNTPSIVSPLDFLSQYKWWILGGVGLGLLVFRRR